jgi:four helix bundle protein
MKITRFEDLECWKEAVSLAVEIYRVSKEGEFGKDFGFRDQLRRAAVSVASNIAEGKERETVSEFIRFLYIAKGSAGELRTQLQIAKEVGYLEKEEFEGLKGRAEKMGGMIGNLIKVLKRSQ